MVVQSCSDIRLPYSLGVHIWTSQRANITTCVETTKPSCSSQGEQKQAVSHNMQTKKQLSVSKPKCGLSGQEHVTSSICICPSIRL